MKIVIPEQKPLHHQKAFILDRPPTTAIKNQERIVSPAQDLDDHDMLQNHDKGILMVDLCQQHQAGSKECGPRIHPKEV